MHGIDLVVHIEAQRLDLFEDRALAASYPVSTAIRGEGCEAHSEKTPLGEHRVCMKAGEHAPVWTVFRGRVPTGEVLAPPLMPDGDWIVGRLLWLEGMEPGVNQGGSVDTRRRYIYIHGTHELSTLGHEKLSHGCIRMSPHDIIDLYPRVPLRTRVCIKGYKT